MLFGATGEKLPKTIKRLLKVLTKLLWQIRSLLPSCRQVKVPVCIIAPEQNLELLVVQIELKAVEVILLTLKKEAVFAVTRVQVGLELVYDSVKLLLHLAKVGI